MANKRQPLNRLVGLETEYAMRFRPAARAATRPLRVNLFHAIVGELSQRIPTAPARSLKEGFFLANGGAVWLEQVRFSVDAALIEGSTPECRGVWQTICYQRAQDRLLAEAAAAAAVPGELTLVKNDRDSRDNVYGAQENYEVPLGGPISLFLWRVGLLLAVPLILIAWIGLVVAVLIVLGYLLLAGGLYAVIHPFLVPERRRSVLRVLFGDGILRPGEHDPLLPTWLDRFASVVDVAVTFPLAFWLYLLIRLVAHRRVRRQLLPFLVTRAVFTGAGMIDSSGEFQLADKAPAMNCVLGFGGLVGDRPIFSVGHFIKPLMSIWLAGLRPALDLMNPSQRLQIALGDSNMAEEAEYLRIGTTLLVLDAIEAGTIDQLPKLSGGPITALRAVCSDQTLGRSVATIGGRQATAIEVQRYYWEACRRYLAEHAQTSDEARRLLERWAQVLDDLQHDRDSLVGRVDWVTKRWLLDETKPRSMAEKKKIDLRYHELSPQGYFRRLEQTGEISRMLEDAAIERAMRNPPSGTPATTRGRFIREFASGATLLRASWHAIFIGRGREGKTVPLHKFRPSDANE